MIWTLTNFLIEIGGGIAGGLAIGTVLKEYAFGALWHMLAGAAGGAVSGYFLQTVVATVVDSTGAVHQDPDIVTQWLLQALGGIVAGLALTMAIGIVIQGIAHRRATAGGNE
jgi:hypothetical protein